jgi:hypothetical protein
MNESDSTIWDQLAARFWSAVSHRDDAAARRWHVELCRHEARVAGRKGA